MRNLVVMFLLVFTSGCEETPMAYPWLTELDAGDGVKHSGQRLMSLDFGLHPLEPVDQQTNMLIGVHGYASEGYEWVYPLQTLDNQETASYFFRWDFTECAAPSAETLRQSITQLLKASPHLESVRVVGHSFGGVLVSHLLADWSPAVPIEVHAIAAPLAGMGGITGRCDYAPPSAIADNMSFHQWRTQHHLDSAFKALDQDPQIIELTKGSAVVLPDTYRTFRLGHNWSISWVADELTSM
jgi:pimeloyl-ACP methyl ester carboxylesterase